MRNFHVSTDRLTLSWRAAPREETPEAPGALSVVRLDAGPEPEVRVDDGRVLPEETTVTLLVRHRSGGAIAVTHDDPTLLRGLASEGDAVHGTVRFGSVAGTSAFTLWADGVPHVRVAVEVVPSKLDYRRDFRALVRDVRGLAEDLALAYVAPASLASEAGPGEAHPATAFAVLGASADALEAALGFAARQPLRSLVVVPADEAPHRAQRSTPALHRALARRGPEAAVLPQAVRRWSADTPEHRWLAAHLREAVRLLGRLEGRRGSGVRARAVREQAGALRKRLEPLLRRPPLDAVPPDVSAPLPAHRLDRAPGYREAAQALRHLHAYLRLAAGPLPLRLRDLHRLYETWCFLTLARSLARATGTPLPVERMLRPAPDGLGLRLAGGRQRLAFPLPGGGRLVLRFAPRLAAPGALVPQRPDLLLTHLMPGQPPLRFVLDAKYRLDARPATVARYGVPAPPAEALGTLHRYRDAIVERSGAARRVVQAVVLYPWRDDGTYASSRLAAALDGLGVGALPLLPGSTALLEAWIASVVAR